MNITFDALCAQIEKEMKNKRPLVLAIDGNSASGKTTLAAQLAERFRGDVIHMDDFFLPLHLRNPERLNEPGGNVHYERFLEQIIQPLTAHKAQTAVPLTDAASPFSLTWQRFDCAAGGFSPNLCHSGNAPLLIIEGAYSMRPEFRTAYDMTLFLSADLETQKERILLRNGQQKLTAFLEKWIPMENRYFTHYRIAEKCRFQASAEDFLSENSPVNKSE